MLFDIASYKGITIILNLKFNFNCCKLLPIAGRVNARIESQRKALQDVETRVKLAQTKVDKLKGSKKAIQV